MRIYTIGFTKSTAEGFFERLKNAGIGTVLDVRLKNSSQLAGFARVPDIQYFLEKLVGAKYIHDPYLAPTEEILSAYKKREIGWAEYEEQFDRLMEERDIDEYIKCLYPEIGRGKWCLLCSEDSANHCHRRLIAERVERLTGAKAVHL